MRLKLFVGLFTLLCLSLGTAWADKGKIQATPKPGQSMIEVVFAVDTTGSMGGLIQAAKDKVWSIVGSLGAGTPSSMIRVGLVAYRDRGDVYITKRVDLITDLDAFYTELMQLKAEGGGDGPESVNQALNEAVTRISWSNSSDAYKVIFLVGDYPPHMDYKDDVKYQETCKLAQAADVLINTVQCGNVAETTPVWKEIAQLGAGQCFQIAQDGGTVVQTTPYDAKIVKLSQQVDGTMIYYGDEKAQAAGNARLAATSAIACGAPADAQADRAMYNGTVSGSLRFINTNELLYDFDNKQVDLKKIPEKQLPANMQKMKPAEREKYVKAQVAQRNSLNKQIAALNVQRQAYLKEQAAKTPQYKTSFDYLVLNCIKDQAAKKHINYTLPKAKP